VHDRWLKALAQGGMLKGAFYLAANYILPLPARAWGFPQGVESVRSLVWWGNPLAFVARHNFFFSATRCEARDEDDSKKCCQKTLVK
jgi:hypothetical protein